MTILTAVAILLLFGMLLLIILLDGSPLEEVILWAGGQLWCWHFLSAYWACFGEPWPQSVSSHSRGALPTFIATPPSVVIVRCRTSDLDLRHTNRIHRPTSPEG